MYHDVICPRLHFYMFFIFAVDLDLDCQAEELSHLEDCCG